MVQAPGQDEMFARIRLLRSPNVGPVSYAQLLRRFGTAAAAIAALPGLARRGVAAYRVADARRVEDEIAQVRRSGARYLSMIRRTILCCCTRSKDRRRS